MEKRFLHGSVDDSETSPQLKRLVHFFLQTNWKFFFFKKSGITAKTNKVKK